MALRNEKIYLESRNVLNAFPAFSCIYKTGISNSQAKSSKLESALIQICTKKPLTVFFLPFL